jgi:hypothetical protein
MIVDTFDNTSTTCLKRGNFICELRNIERLTPETLNAKRSILELAPSPHRLLDLNASLLSAQRPFNTETLKH